MIQTPLSRTPLQWVLIIFVRSYQLILSPLLGPCCRFQPTCSSYALEAIKMHGGFKGLWLTIKRITRCHPWGGHGFDPVPGICNDMLQASSAHEQNVKCNNHAADFAGVKKGTSTDG